MNLSLKQKIQLLIIAASVALSMTFAVIAPVWMSLASGTWWWLVVYVFYSVCLISIFRV